MDECQHAMEELRNIVEGISKLRDTAYAHYSLLVEQVLKDQITDEQQLEQIMDGLCDFCDEIRFIDLYRSLCRHIYYQYPQLVGEHVVGNNDLDFYKFLNENGGLPDVITCCRFSLHDAQPLKDSLTDLSTSNEAGAVYNTYLFAGRGLQNDRGRVQRGAGV